MMLDPEFAAHLAHLDEVSLSTSSDVVCVIDADFVLRAYNPAWRQFAARNGGPQLLRSYGIGRSILPAIPEPLQSFYTDRYRAALSSGKPFEHDYECSSPDRYRRFHQTAYPLPDRSGLLISHHLVAESAAQTELADASAATTAFFYRDASGAIIQCMHCRKLRRPSDPAHWDWVPALVEKPATETSHALCPRCLDFYYPDLPDSAAAKP